MTMAIEKSISISSINQFLQQVEPDGHGPGRLPAVPAGGAAGAAPAERRGRRRPHPRPPPHRQGLLRPPRTITTGMDAVLNILDSNFKRISPEFCSDSSPEFRILSIMKSGLLRVRVRPGQHPAGERVRAGQGGGARRLRPARGLFPARVQVQTGELVQVT